MQDLTTKVRSHYAHDGIADTILEAVSRATGDKQPLTPDDLAPLDQMHMRGIEATRDLAEHAGIKNGDRVLDIGSGLGGPARTFAAETGCEVVGVDLVPEFVETARALTDRTGLSKHVAFRQADVLDLPFDDDTFDVVTSMAAFMNIQDKAGAYKEIRRVLRPGGRLAHLEVMQGPGGDVHFPILWAQDPSLSFLETPETIRRLLTAAGFTQHVWVDEDQAALGWAQTLERMMKEQGPPLGPHIIIGPEAAVRIGNANRSLAERRVTTAMIVMEATKTAGGGAKPERIARH